MYVQEIGRAGRDGLPSVATLYYNASDIASNVPALDDDMRDYCRSTACKRQFLSAYFMYVYEQNSILHECCSSCAAFYTCDVSKIAATH